MFGPRIEVFPENGKTFSIKARPFGRRELLGFAVGYVLADTVYLENIYAKQENNGVGTLLFGEFILEAERRGARVLTGRLTSLDPEGAKRFYEKMGVSVNKDGILFRKIGWNL